jgi:hypothetical protein
MAQQPKRIPGDRNPQPDGDAPMHVAREGWMANGHGTGDYGIARGIMAVLDWRKRRKARKAR